jgi:hypothetical protein
MYLEKISCNVADSEKDWYIAIPLQEQLVSGLSTVWANFQ